MNALAKIHDHLYRAYGAQHWWPAASPFEMMVGGVLTQNTAWTNVEAAIENLHIAGYLDLAKMRCVPSAQLAGIIRPAGFYRVKAKRLHNLCIALEGAGGIASVTTWPTIQLREFFLGINGIGPETCDAILLYAFGRPVFVVDAYFRRIFSRIGLIAGDEKYETLRSNGERELNGEAVLYNEFHALVVEHAKQACRAQPLCERCCLRNMCDSSTAA